VSQPSWTGDSSPVSLLRLLNCVDSIRRPGPQGDPHHNGRRTPGVPDLMEIRPAHQQGFVRAKAAHTLGQPRLHGPLSDDEQMVALRMPVGRLGTAAARLQAGNGHIQDPVRLPEYPLGQKSHMARNWLEPRHISPPGAAAPGSWQYPRP